MQETQVQSLGQDPLKKEMATHSSILAWEIPWTEKPPGPQSMGSQRVEHNLATDFHLFFLTYYKCFHLPLKECLLPPIMLFMLI